MINIKLCPNCESYLIEKYPKFGNRPYVLYEIMPGVRIKAGIISTYFACQDCGLIFQNPRMSDSDLDKFYSSGYYRKMLDDNGEVLDGDELQRSKVDAEVI